MQKGRQKPQKQIVAAIHEKKQPKRPHYVGRLMELRGVTRGQMFEELPNLDKSLLSRWLDEDDPTTPGKDWAARLGEYFKVSPDDEPVDIFADPDVDWIARLLRGRSAEEKDRIKRMVEAAFPVKRAG